MTKPHGRQTKKKVTQILSDSQGTEALSLLELIPEEQLVGPLFSHFYAMDELIKFRSIIAMGELAQKLSLKQMERARILMRRIMWNLNDESGGIGWGSPEAMGQILYKSPALAMEFKSILFSYLDHRGNFIEHELLQRGVLWGIGTYLKALAASANQVPFFVALPASTVDWLCPQGSEIPIEERSGEEVLQIGGLDSSGKYKTVHVAAAETSALNPAFDVTPASLVSKLLTEYGAFSATPEGMAELRNQLPDHLA